jgi:hypothetical protein
VGVMWGRIDRTDRDDGCKGLRKKGPMTGETRRAELTYRDCPTATGKLAVGLGRLTAVAPFERLGQAALERLTAVAPFERLGQAALERLTAVAPFE